MPRKNIYIKEEDLAKWEALPNKSEFVHNALKGVCETRNWNDRMIGSTPKPIKTRTDTPVQGIPAPNATFVINSPRGKK